MQNKTIEYEEQKYRSLEQNMTARNKDSAKEQIKSKYRTKL
jgi:hypothetical protein